jgi:hypothetical protein
MNICCAVLCSDSLATHVTFIRDIQGVHFAGLLDVQNILLADTAISQQTEGHSYGDHLISGSVSQCYAIERDRSFYCALFCVFMTHVSQSINQFILNFLIRLCPFNTRFYRAQTNTNPLKATAYGYLHTTKTPLNSTSIINDI